MAKVQNVQHISTYYILITDMKKKQAVDQKNKNIGEMFNNVNLDIFIESDHINTKVQQDETSSNR